ncbi:unnamed protein product [Owenia fusiformis]|uniref:EF-hand domain-containing protein n=1 Tax=Owenia fusiformis TaxID=6347 RepID=A0A8S4NRE0_OWEFU|nr:unnamed protein product [Owenia fusiformis]
MPESDWPVGSQSTIRLVSSFPYPFHTYKMAEEKKSKAGSNVFAMFPQAQIQEFKEAFTLLDANRDGFIDVSDLQCMYANLGLEPKKADIEAMIKECPGQLNFTAFLTLFGEKMHGTDPEGSIKSAFEMFDDDRKGILEEDYIKDLLTNMGDNFTKDEIKSVWKEAPIHDKQFDYVRFTKMVKGSDQQE